jgi:hypothetical protein
MTGDTMTGDTLFDHQVEHQEEHEDQVEAIRCRTLAPDCGCSRKVGTCAFSTWAVAVSHGLAISAPADINLPKNDAAPVPDPVADPLGFRLSKKALGSHYPGERVSLPGHYAFSYNPLDQGVVLLNVLYSRAHEPVETLTIDHRAGYRAYEPGVCRVERFFAAGFIEKGENKAELVYSENHINIRALVCRTQEDLEALYRKIMQSRITRCS